MTLMRWDPFRELTWLERTVDELFREFARPFFQVERREWAWVPAMDMYETDDAVVVKLALPGVDPDKVEIRVSGDLLTIRGRLEDEVVEEDATYYIRERRVGAFSRTIQLPVPVEADEAEAVFENGVLTLTLPKAEEVRPKTIAITTDGKKKGRLLRGKKAESK